MKFEIRNRLTGNVQFTAEIDCSDGALHGFKVGLAVKWAIKNGAALSGAALSGADLSGAALSGAGLSGADLSGAALSGAALRGADLSGADLSGADLSGADLSGADLSGADLSGAALSGAEWIPKITNIHQAVLEAVSADGALEMGSWHKGGFCGTTHCRAGWVTHLAGEGGRVLDGAYGTAAAAALIYMASDPNLERIPDFYCDNETAMADIKVMAEREGATQ